MAKKHVVIIDLNVNSEVPEQTGKRLNQFDSNEGHSEKVVDKDDFMLVTRYAM